MFFCKYPHQYRANQCGNVLFFILIAVILFAALSFAVTQSGRNTNGAILGSEKSSALASEMLDYSNALKTAVQQLKIKGVREKEISFATALLSGYTNSDCSTADCQVFSPTGGAVIYQKPPIDWLDSSYEGQANYGEWIFVGNACIADIGLGGTGCESDSVDNEELIAIMPYVKQSICTQLVEKSGLSTMPVNVGADSLVKFTGTFSEGSLFDTVTRPFGCFSGGGMAGYYMYQVLLAR
jgi:hypothetical protein